jgi:YesN/AraC family two-component response regulator
MPRPANALIVDDEPHVTVLLRGILKQLGVETAWEAADGTEALAKVAIHKPEVVLLDINLPQMDGMHVLEKIRADHPTTPVIMVSAQSTVRSVSRAEQLGATGYVVKFAPKTEVLKSLSDLFDAIALKDATGNGGEPAEAPKP